MHKCRRYCLALGLVLGLFATGCATELDGDEQNPDERLPPDNACLTVSFSYTPSINVQNWAAEAGGIQNVLVVGSFNGYIPSAQSGAFAMSKQQDGTWTATHTFSKRGQIRYAFVANTIYWEPGSAAQTVPDYFGGAFAVKDVCESTSEPATVVFRYLENTAPPSVYLMGLNNDWTNGIAMTRYGEQLWFATISAATLGMGKHEYKFRVPGATTEWRIDSFALNNQCYTEDTPKEERNNCFHINAL